MRQQWMVWRSYGGHPSAFCSEGDEEVDILEDLTKQGKNWEGLTKQWKKWGEFDKTRKNWESSNVSDGLCTLAAAAKWKWNFSSTYLDAAHSSWEQEQLDSGAKLIKLRMESFRVVGGPIFGCRRWWGCKADTHCNALETFFARFAFTASSYVPGVKHIICVLQGTQG